MSTRDPSVIVVFDMARSPIRVISTAVNVPHERSDPMAVLDRKLEAQGSLGISRRRAVMVTGVVTLGSIGLLGDLLLVGHTNGEEIWGVVTAASGVLIGVLSLAFLVKRGRNRVARIGLIALWLTVAFFGFGGYNSHRLPLPEGMTDQRPRPPLAPLIFTGFGIAGALAVRSGSKGA